MFKHFISLLFLVLAINISSAQNAFDIINSHGRGDATTEQVSLANPWVGSELSYNLDEDRPLNESFLLSAKVLYVPVSGERFAVPVVGEVGLGDGDILNPGSGVNLGIYPYYRLSNVGGLELYAHGGIGYKVIEADVEDGPAPQQVRLVAGLEAVFTPADGGSPTTLSVTPVYLFNTNSTIGNTGGLEITGILPIATGVGFLAEGLLPFNNGEFSTGLRLGVIINTQL